MDSAAIPSLRTSWPRVLLLAGLLLAFALRLHRLGAESLWYDETVSVFLAMRPLPDLIAHTARDIHPPGYYLLLRGWGMLANPTLAHGLEFLYTWPSLWLSMISIALLAALARQYAGMTSAALAVLLAALNPFQLMYAQEVRMYTLGTTCVLLTLWAANAHTQSYIQPAPLVRNRWGPLTVYTAAAAIGLYTLYYFLFWLAILVPLVALILLRHAGDRSRLDAVRPWFVAQLLVVAAWLPWLPVFLRQALDPPVPPWREPWARLSDLATALAEAAAAPLIGQSPPGEMLAVWGVLVVLVVAAFIVYTKNAAEPTDVRLRTGRWLLPSLLWGPPALIFGVSLVFTPLYHVRYLVLYSSLFPLISALLIDRLRRTRLIAVACLLLIAGISAAAAVESWRMPHLRADDHRSAVATLAREWRPGDAILVNAGWVYTALAVYWPTTPTAAHNAIPPAISAFPRLSAFSDPESAQSAPQSPLSPVVIRSGSVDAPPTLGWGHPDSDFFAISAAETEAALSAITSSHARLWHYRLYDTVSDPTGRIRSALEANGAPFLVTPLPGPGYLRLEGYDLAGPVPILGSATSPIRFGENVSLQTAHVPPSVTAGSYLYVVTVWNASGDAQDGPLATSLRLHAPDGSQAAQADVALPEATVPFTQTLALPIARNTAPGPYTLELIVYRHADLSPLPAEPASPGTPAARLGEVQVTPNTPPSSSLTGRPP